MDANNAGQEPSPSPPATPPVPADPGSAFRPGLGWRAWLALPAGLLAALAVWMIGETGALSVKPAIGQYQLFGVKITDATPETRRAAANWTASRSFAAFGGLEALACGLAGLLAASRLKEPRLLGLVGLLAALGGILAGGAGFFLPKFLEGVMISTPTTDMIHPALVHAAIFAIVGATAGAAFGAGLGRSCASHAMLGGLLGAVLGGIVYEVVGAIALPLDGTSLPIAGTAAARAAMYLLVGLGLSLGACLAVRGPRALPVA